MSPALLDAESIYFTSYPSGEMVLRHCSKAEAAFVPHCWWDRQWVLAVSSLIVSVTSGIIVSARDKVIDTVSNFCCL
ncbi:hypothetical protein BO85DRAFT_251464 [Aspergillus piperis CBS 112811]|uniref:Uncharacterized protein n=1 Tax=Aspergillus piperis CBS 112811 TaxID=1448313 RepID=A0A8G1R8J8_9EURO|nr:hypothetical protein BO85DRAFT_251464 [Aspergillus piperis CBS 112811]RAH59850.1 hypothetical protein BO85DRAFT_251464 [Aspergillus piperis CBS 112811]